MMRLREYLKLKFYEVLNSTRAEYRPGGNDNANEYVINGVRYIVTTCFSKTENKTMKEKIADFIGSDFAHLTNENGSNTMGAEYVNMTAGEGRINAGR